MKQNRNFLFFNKLTAFLIREKYFLLLFLRLISIKKKKKLILNRHGRYEVLLSRLRASKLTLIGKYDEQTI